ncbi:MAG TPA: hypothetical protein VLG11_01695 [Candidatus Saccharimonadales bacterium]|nr:hypothetical protein [Candidatus Saccharimonadales bacterium]
MAHEPRATTGATLESAAGRDNMQLPASIVSTIDVGRLSRELEAFEDYIEQAHARKGGAGLTPPRTSRLLEELTAANNCNLLQDGDRERLKAFLESLAEAPVVHISFAADPSAAFTEKLVRWLRMNIDPHLLVQVGLQPNIAAGCIVRTANKVFDFSLRENFMQKRDLLIKAIEGAA